jgi:predicted HicB family RNase H-like nuclease
MQHLLSKLYILVALMAKDPSKDRVEIHISPELKQELEALAKADKRSLLNYIEVVLDKHVKELKKDL